MWRHFLLFLVVFDIGFSQDCSYMPGKKAGTLHVDTVIFDVCCLLCQDYEAEGCVGWSYNIRTNECQLRDTFVENADVSDINWIHADVEFERNVEFNPECGDCVHEHVGNTCSHEPTMECVCQRDPFCCQDKNTMWDMFCTEHAIESCDCGIIDANSVKTEESLSTDSPVSVETEDVSTDSPVEESDSPVVETVSPVVETDSPVVETDSPVVETQSPVEETDPPVITESDAEPCDDSEQYKLDCPDWAHPDSDQCIENPGFMEKHCKRSCGLCPEETEEVESETEKEEVHMQSCNMNECPIPCPIGVVDIHDEMFQACECLPGCGCDGTGWCYIDPEAEGTVETEGIQETETSGETESSETEISEQEAARLRWEECEIGCYTYLFSTKGDVVETEPIQVDVAHMSDGNTISKNPQGSELFNGQVWKKTIPEVFEWTSEVYDEHERVAIAYDEVCGFPISIRYSSTTLGVSISHLIYFIEKDCDDLIPFLIDSNGSNGQISPAVPAPPPSRPPMLVPARPETDDETQTDGDTEIDGDTETDSATQTNISQTSRPQTPGGSERTSHPTRVPTPERTDRPTPPPTPARTSRPTNVKTSAPRPSQTGRPSVPPTPSKTSRPTNIKTSAPRPPQTDRPTPPPTPTHTKPPYGRESTDDENDSALSEGHFHFSDVDTESEPVTEDLDTPTEDPDTPTEEPIILIENSPYCTLELSGRVGSFDLINGIYEFAGTTPMVEVPYYKHVDKLLYIYYDFQGSSWRISPRLGAAPGFAFVVDTVLLPELIANVWNLQEQNGGSHTPDANVNVKCVEES